MGESDQGEQATSDPEDQVEPRSRWRLGRRRRLGRLSIQSKLLMMLLFTSVVSSSVVGYIGYQSGRDSLREAVFANLVELRESQKRHVQLQLTDIQNSMLIYTRNSAAAAAVEAFTAGFKELETALGPPDREARNRALGPERVGADADPDTAASAAAAIKPVTPDQLTALKKYYEQQYTGPNAIQSSTEPDAADVDLGTLFPTSQAQTYLQVYYTAPFTDWGEAIAFDDAGDGSAWTKANSQYNAYFRSIVEHFDYEDALLIDRDGTVVYSAYKGPDLGTNILTGPFSGGELTDAYKRAMRSNSPDYVAVSDFGSYQASNEPTAWLVSPINDDGELEGALALQFPISRLNQIMTFNENWAYSGMGQTGETFLVGDDGLMRSDSRLFVEDPEAYQADVTEAGTSLAVSDAAIRQDTTVLIQPITSEAVARAQRAETGTLVERDYLGNETLQAYAPLEAGRTANWVVIAKINTAEAFAPVAEFSRNLVLSTVTIIFVVCLAAMLLARLFVRPIQRLKVGAEHIGSGAYGTTLPVRSRDEFGDLTRAFNKMSRKLAVEEDLLNEQRRENDRLLLSLMPEPIVARYRRGEQNIAADHQDVTVLFAELVGLRDLERTLSSEEFLAVLNRLLRQFDAAAENLGVERIRSLRHEYLASCGLTVPRLDSVRRTVDFAAEMQRIVNRHNTESGQQLRVRAGVDTGTVSSGLVDRANLAFDLWGATVDLASRAQHGDARPGIFVTTRVFDAVGRSDDFEASGTILVDGAEEPIYRLVSRR